MVMQLNCGIQITYYCSERSHISLSTHTRYLSSDSSFFLICPHMNIYAAFMSTFRIHIQCIQKVFRPLHFFHIFLCCKLQVGFRVSFTDDLGPSPRLLSLAGQPALRRVLVPNFHLRVMEATVLLGTFSAAEF